MSRIDFSSPTINFDNIRDIPTLDKPTTSKLEEKSTQTASQYNPDNLEAKANQSTLSSSFLKASLLKTSLKAQPSEPNASSRKETPANQPNTSTPAKAETNIKNGYDINKIPGLKGNPNVTPEFLTKVDTLAKELNTEPATILAIMSFESGGTFNPAKLNSDSDAIGLIQFLPSTAQSLLTKTLQDPKGDLNNKKQLIETIPVDKQTKAKLTELATKASELPNRQRALEGNINRLTTTAKDLTTQLRQARIDKLPTETQTKIAAQLKDTLAQRSQLRAEKREVTNEINTLPRAIKSNICQTVATATFKQMSSVKQLDYVKEYLLPYKGRINTPQDAYLSVLHPIDVGKGSSPNAPVFFQGSAAYAQNKGLDIKKDGVITVEEATKKVVDFLRIARKQ